MYYNCFCRFHNDSAESQVLCSEYLNLLPAGEIQTKIDIDREALVETTDNENLTCLVNYKDDQDNSLSLIICVMIEDINDIVPSLFGLQQNITIFENLPIGQVIKYLMPFDLDKGLNGTVNYTIVQGNEMEYFRLRSPSSEGDASPDRLLYLEKELDYEATPVFNLTFLITDQGANPLTSHQNLVIFVADVNDQVPTFDSNFHFDIPETFPIGTDDPFGRVNATDEDSPTHAQIFYSLSQSSMKYSDIFDVNTTTGDLYLLQSIDYDTSEQTVYIFSVEARNPESASGTHAEITVTITDVNDEQPTLNVPLNIEKIPENTIPDLIVATYIDNDKDSPNNEIINVSVSFSPPVIHSVPAIQSFQGQSFYFIRIKINQTLDREKTPFINLTIFVTDNGIPSQTSETSFTITVTDENDNAPQFNDTASSGKVSESSKPDRYVLTVAAYDVDNGTNGEFHFAITGATPAVAESWFDINPVTGDIYLVDEVDYYIAINGRVELEVSAIDHGTNSNTNTTIVEIIILPSITFQPNSFQEYSNVDLIDSTIIYLEFRTDRNDTNALLLYQYSSVTSTATSLQIIDNKLVYLNGNNMIEKPISLLQNQWYSILINKNDLVS